MNGYQDTLWRTYDVSFMNGIVNHPDIRPTIGGEGELDMTLLLSEPKNVALTNGRDAMFFRWTSPGVYEGHSLFLSRGRDAIRVAREMVRAMFVLWNADTLWGGTPVELKAARWFNRQLGFRSVGMDGDRELFLMEYAQCR